jgi:hypothetical protein
MMRAVKKLLPAVIAALILGIAALFAFSGKDEIPAGLPGFGSYTPVAECIEDLPARIEEPEYRPETLTLPAGSVAIRTSPDPAPGLHVVVYRVPKSLDDFVKFLLADWPKQGWVLGRGEREPGEAESVFYLPDKSRYGQVRARQVYCDADQTEVVLTIGEDVT